MASTDPPAAVLSTLRCIGFSSVETVAAVTGLDPGEAESALIDLAVDGLVTRHSGPFGGWGQTAAGREADARARARELEAAGAGPAVAAAYERFLELNPELLDLCSAWQLRRPGDPAAEARVLDLFADLDRRAAPVCDALAAALPRFGRYRPGLARALEHARAGRTEYLTDHLASYHTLWFQLHEDLLATLGIPR
ncbi:transcriptional regulator [Nocardiopsis changdeensis]|uniref:transcriptional regulator n=1 Tax=Nocardiopsis changdeensis TaxID=2831969 RepID=UPI003F44D644